MMKFLILGSESFIRWLGVRVGASMREGASEEDVLVQKKSN